MSEQPERTGTPMAHQIGDLAEVLSNLGVFRVMPEDVLALCPSGFRRVPINQGSDHYLSLQGFAPDQIAYAHTHPDSEEWVVVLTGAGRALLSDVPVPLEPGVVIGRAAANPHGFHSAGGPLHLLSLQVPRPSEATTTWDQPGETTEPIDCASGRHVPPLSPMRRPQHERPRADVPLRELHLRVLTTRGYGTSITTLPTFCPVSTVPVRVDDLLQRVAPIDQRRERARLDQLLQVHHLPAAVGLRDREQDLAPAEQRRDQRQERVLRERPQIGREVDALRDQQPLAPAERAPPDDVGDHVVALLVLREVLGPVVDDPVGAEPADELDVLGGADRRHRRSEVLQDLDRGGTDHRSRR